MSPITNVVDVAVLSDVPVAASKNVDSTSSAVYNATNVDAVAVSTEILAAAGKNDDAVALQSATGEDEYDLPLSSRWCSAS